MQHPRCEARFTLIGACTPRQTGVQNSETQRFAWWDRRAAAWEHVAIVRSFKPRGHKSAETQRYEVHHCGAADRTFRVILKRVAIMARTPLRLRNANLEKSAGFLQRQVCRACSFRRKWLKYKIGLRCRIIQGVHSRSFYRKIRSGSVNGACRRWNASCTDEVKPHQQR